MLLITEVIDNVIDFFEGDRFLVRFGIDDEQDETSGGCDLINNAIASTFSFTDVAIFGSYFEDGVARTRNTIAWTFACLQLL